MYIQGYINILCYLNKSSLANSNPLKPLPFLVTKCKGRHSLKTYMQKINQQNRSLKCQNMNESMRHTPKDGHLLKTILAIVA